MVGSKVISSQNRLGNTGLAEILNLEQEADNQCSKWGRAVNQDIFTVCVFMCVCLVDDAEKEWDISSKTLGSKKKKEFRIKWTGAGGGAMYCIK